MMWKQETLQGMFRVEARAMYVPVRHGVMSIVTYLLRDSDTRCTRVHHDA